MSIYQKLADVWRARCVEPVKRNKDGVRWIVHRFPIKGGISLRDAMLQDMSRTPPFLAGLSQQIETTFNYMVDGSVEVIEHIK